jgi:hypothetical protein
LTHDSEGDRVEWYAGCVVRGRRVSFCISERPQLSNSDAPHAGPFAVTARRFSCAGGGHSELRTLLLSSLPVSILTTGHRPLTTNNLLGLTTVPPLCYNVHMITKRPRSLPASGAACPPRQVSSVHAAPSRVVPICLPVRLSRRPPRLPLCCLRRLMLTRRVLTPVP